MVWPRSYFILIGRAVFTCFDLRQTGSFSVTDSFLTTFYRFEKLNSILRKNRGRGLKNLTYDYREVGRGGQKLPKSCLRN